MNVATSVVITGGAAVAANAAAISAMNSSRHGGSFGDMPLMVAIVLGGLFVCLSLMVGGVALTEFRGRGLADTLPGQVLTGITALLFAVLVAGFGVALVVSAAQ